MSGLLAMLGWTSTKKVESTQLKPRPPTDRRDLSVPVRNVRIEGGGRGSALQTGRTSIGSRLPSAIAQRGGGVASAASQRGGVDKFRETFREREDESEYSASRPAASAVATTGRRYSFTPGLYEPPSEPAPRHTSTLPAISLERESGITRYGKSAHASTSGAAPSSSSASASSQGGGAKGKLCCDKCDKEHKTEDCPYFKKGRESHPDGQKGFYKKLGGTSNLPGQKLSSAKVIRQPGDGSCLFHSMSYGLSDGSSSGMNASRLRAEICDFIRNNPQHKICETPLEDWIKWDSGGSCGMYANKMSRGSWGGGIEMAVTSHIKGCNVHVYEKAGWGGVGGYRRISAFDHPDNPERRRCIKVLYCGGVHYDAIS